MKELNSYKIMSMKNLINSARTILEKEGIDAITIRKVGDLSGFNSATMYNYFENLEHLKVFVCLFSFEEYLDDIKNYIKKSDDEIMYNYFAVWECFLLHTMKNVDVFYTLFFNQLNRSISEYVDEYYSVFPREEKDYGDVINSMLKNYSIESRNILMVKDIARKGYIEESSIDFINDLTSFTYESILFRVYKGFMSPEEGKSQIMKYVRSILESKLIKK
ncbi:TetR/AcrR family transcriptional regulator [Peptostreptococcus sp. D1]|uniref:TetR/AcrR family transcriptional regulator n=1 Tax=Peptostreptococcus sp. D1 TaxID=72304 RepID=UPI0008EDAD9D|nr:TetR/AcrR family transcriptional regulator [Peptostreptococcus sp. D1]SFE20518.1 transcriptional regulator, TetR family [Peptostreptococcus sp. D1]